MGWGQRETEQWHQGCSSEALAVTRALPPLGDRKAPGRPYGATGDVRSPRRGVRRLGTGLLRLDPEGLAELLDAADSLDWTELDVSADVDQVAALLDDLPDEVPGA
ncbi:hypothetical protein GCM10010095_70680 [Streptomyces anthocyanicus]|uniref:Uncharacterized protein n=1 Tax=Streptomyces violaceolatus TaxID=67378 RepID=A0ABN3TD67_9ACTN|nr:hypothetical protein GCM10010095_70680 [Streptomyces anthocyanicus]